MNKGWPPFNPMTGVLIRKNKGEFGQRYTQRKEGKRYIECIPVHFIFL